LCLGNGLGIYTVKLRHNYIDLKGLVHPKMKILSVVTHPHVVPTP